MRLFHFSDRPDIADFQPRPIRVPVDRPPGQDWLNGSLVWAIDELHQILYLFPRRCPRIVIWATPFSTHADRLTWMGESSARAVAYIESSWLGQLRSATLYRYEMPADTFEDIKDVGMWVSRTAVRPIGVDILTALDMCLASARVELRAVDELTPLRHVWESTLHASGIRLRNAKNWSKPG